MVKRLNLEPEVQKIFEHIDQSENFILSGGAGSGKTYSLVQVIKQVVKEHSSSSIACITYTNTAVREIESRVSHKNLSVSTIHDFLWNNIKHFQSELKISLITLMNEENSKIPKPSGETIHNQYFDNLESGIQYKEFLKIKEGIISHDEIIILASHLFKNYPKLCDILKDRFKFIFVDEYQDTSKDVTEILLNHLSQSTKKNIIGFFGDSMQAIYEDGVGNLNEYSDNVKEVIKTQNRRNPQLVINLANAIRTDGITQSPSTDISAPNMLNGKIKNGNIKFYFSQNCNLEQIKTATGWNYLNTKETKILNLTHNLIAPNAGFENLMDIYDKDKILEYVKRLKNYIKDNNIIEDLSEMNLEEVIQFLESGKTGAELKKVQPTKGMQDFITAHASLYQLALKLLFKDLCKIYIDKDQLIDDKKQSQDDEKKKGSKRDDLIKHLFKIQNNISLYSNGFYNDFIKITEYKIASVSDKQELKKKIDSLINVQNKTIEEVIDHADTHGICKKDDKLSRFISEKKYIYDRVKSLTFAEFQLLYKYLEGNTPFSTKHKTKGAEFENVLVILDNGGWNHYNFKGLFEQNGTASVMERSVKIFYVCCTRAKENLAVYFHQPSPQVIEQAKKWFGEENIVEIT